MNLKEIRKGANLTQLQLSIECGCERSTIGKVEAGVITPSVKLAKKIGQVLNFDWTLFYKDEEEEEDEKNHTGNDGRGIGSTCTGD